MSVCSAGAATLYFIPTPQTKFVPGQLSRPSIFELQSRGFGQETDRYSANEVPGQFERYVGLIVERNDSILSESVAPVFENPGSVLEIDLRRHAGDVMP